MTDAFVQCLRESRLTPIVVIHANHAAELDESVETAIAQLQNANVTVLNQSVLLKGVNDNTDILVELSQKLIDHRVMPYYLHQLDRVAGAAHFEVPQATGLKLIEEMRARLPGYAVPRYVQELPGRTSKTVLA